MTSSARRIVTTCTLLLLALPATASAGSISVSDGRLVMSAGSDYLDVDVLQDGDEVSVYDWSGEMTTGDGCEEAPPDPVAVISGDPTTHYTCAGVTAGIDVDGGATSDYVYLSAAVATVMRGGSGEDYLYADGAPARLEGGDGDDSLRSGEHADTLVGGAGNDDLRSDPPVFGPEGGEAPPARGSADTLDGGPGRDTLVGGAGADTVSGGDGRDTLAFPGATPTTVSLAGAAGEGDVISGIELLQTGDGDDAVTGDERFNELRTGDGKDTVDARGGSDLIDSGAGDDTVSARDGAADDVVCGDGADRVVADPDDFVDADCEVVERAPLAVATPAAPAAPVLQLKARARRERLVVTGRVVPAAGTPAGACTGGGVSVSILRLGRRVRKLGTVLRPDCTFTLRVKAKRKRARRARVSATFAGTPALAAVAAPPVRVRG